MHNDIKRAAIVTADLEFSSAGYCVGRNTVKYSVTEGICRKVTSLESTHIHLGRLQSKAFFSLS